MLLIRDEQLTKELTQIAERENRPVEAVLKSMLDRYSSEPAAVVADLAASDAIQQVRRKAYAKARRYWEQVGEFEKARLNDVELDEQFGVFDEEGIPRLKHELLTAEPPPGSLAYAALISERGAFRSGRPDLARSSKELLDTHFADDLATGTRGDDANEQNSR